jgi:ADP-heptose:LPS heptosyltransferase
MAVHDVVTARPMSPDRILVIKLGAFGDIVMAEGVFRDLRAHHPGAEITVLTRPGFARLLRRCPSFDRVTAEPRDTRWRPDRTLAHWIGLRRGGFGRVYDLQNNRRTVLLRRLVLPAPVWSTLPLLPPDQRAPETKPSMMVRFAGQMAAAGVPVRHTPDPNPDWMVDDASDALAAAGVAGPYVVLVPGSSAGLPHKRWPHYAALARALVDRGVPVVTVPGPDEIDLCRALPGRALLEGDGRPLDWFRLAGVLKGAALVVGNDTGPTHLGVHLGRPTVALFGSHVSPQRTGLTRPWVSVLRRPAIAGIAPAEALAAVDARLGTAGRA